MILNLSKIKTESLLLFCRDLILSYKDKVDLENSTESKQEVSNRLNEEDRAHPLYWARLQGYPFILIYRQGWPAAMYNGERNSQAILDFALTLACNPNYIEKINSFKSTVSDENLSGIETKTEEKEKTSSKEFTRETPVRKSIKPMKEEVVIETTTSTGDIAMPIKRELPSKKIDNTK